MGIAPLVCYMHHQIKFGENETDGRIAGLEAIGKSIIYLLFMASSSSIIIRPSFLHFSINMWCIHILDGMHNILIDIVQAGHGLMPLDRLRLRTPSLLQSSVLFVVLSAN